MQVSHEVPLSLLDDSRWFNDYHYCLVHLLEKYSEYLQFFKNCITKGERVILDNSIFELGTTYSSENFAKWVQKLQPTEYIIPDSLEDLHTTLTYLHNWVKYYNSLSGKKIGVVQGRSWEELVECYKEIDAYCDKIAISFDYSYYKFLLYDKTPPTTFDTHKKRMLYKYYLGRPVFIKSLLDAGILNTNKPHHLLGCSLPQEFKFYKEWGYTTFLETIDTSNPIVHGLLRIRYDREYGLIDKEPIKLNQLIEEDVSSKQFKDIMWNVKYFKKIAQ